MISLVWISNAVKYAIIQTSIISDMLKIDSINWFTLQAFNRRNLAKNPLFIIKLKLCWFRQILLTAKFNYSGQLTNQLLEVKIMAYPDTVTPSLALTNTHCNLQSSFQLAFLFDGFWKAMSWSTCLKEILINWITTSAGSRLTSALKLLSLC